MIYFPLMKKRTINQLKESDLISLEDAYQNSDQKHVRERSKCILMCNSGYDVKELTGFFGTRRQTIYSWIDRWEFAGIAGFLNKSGQGRKPTLDVTCPEQLELIEKTVSQHPQNLSGVAVEISIKLGIPVTKWKLKSFLKKTAIDGNE
jgi:transposase